MELNKECLCPKTKCKRHGDCIRCRKHHKKHPPFCDREPKIEGKTTKIREEKIEELK